MAVPSDPISNRILLFFFCWCLLALPIHYFTCAVERNSIPPLDSVLNKSVTFSIQINLHCISQSEAFCSTTNLDASNRIQRQFNHMQHMDHFKLNLMDHTYNQRDILDKCESSNQDVLYLNCLQSISQQRKNEIGTYDLYLIHSDDTPSSWVVSPYRSAWVHTDSSDDANAALTQLPALMEQMVYASLEATQINMKVKNQMFSFTLLNSEPEIGHRFVWDMNAIYTDYLVPFFNRIHNVLIYDYHVDSQILHYGYIISQPPTDDIHVDRADFSTILKNYIQKDRKGDYFFVTNKELQTFVGGTDWNRASSLVNDVAPIQFVIYIPPRKYSPLHIKTNNEKNPYDAFLVPRFGGCVIYNVDETNTTANKIEIDTQDLYPTFNVVISQLRLLLGLRNDYNYNDDSILFIMDETGINDWELDVLIRAHIVNDLQVVELALKNIYAMIHKVSQLPIKLDVACLITDAISAFDEALISCNENRNYIECIQWTKHSNHLAQKAEYHPSMLPTLYFSPEFTYAVYSPYFLPG
eukprot:549778_1